jgi:hypothetical protein
MKGGGDNLRVWNHGYKELADWTIRISYSNVELMNDNLKQSIIFIEM